MKPHNNFCQKHSDNKQQTMQRYMGEEKLIQATTQQTTHNYKQALIYLVVILKNLSEVRNV